MGDALEGNLLESGSRQALALEMQQQIASSGCL